LTHELRRDLAIAIGDEAERLEAALHDQIERIDDLEATSNNNVKTLSKLGGLVEIQGEEQVRLFRERWYQLFIQLFQAWSVISP
jgi:hypothetical protein